MSNSQSPSSYPATHTPHTPDSHASPIPVGNLGFSHTGSTSTTPESEIESSLAYKGTERFGGRARNNRKVEKRHELAKSKLSEDENVDNNENNYKLDTEDSSDSENSEGVDKNRDEGTENTDPSSELKKSARNVRFRNAESKIAMVPEDSKVQQKHTMESKAVQTDLVWSEIENIFVNTDTVGLDGMKQLISRLKDELIGRKQDIPEVNFDELVSEESLSDEILSEDGSTEDEYERTEVKSPIVKAKQSITQDDGLLHSYGGTTLPAMLNSRRINSAHTFGQRKETLPDAGNIIDQFRARGEEAVKVKPEILKYVGEKSEIRLPDVDGETCAKPCVKGWSDELCQFCGKQLLDVPTLKQIQDPVMSSYIKYCCAQFKYFINLCLMNEEAESVCDEVIDVNTDVQSKNRKTAQERIADRQRQREIERQKAAVQQANLFAFAKTMKTIQFSLASAKCMDDGWTIKPISPLPTERISKENLFEIDVNSTLLQSAGVLVDKLYDNGNPFLTIFPDGTGCCYYPSGNVAVMISSTEKGKYTYIVQSNKCYDDLEDSGLLAIFEPNGNSVCYYQNNERIRTFVNANGGIELDPKGRRKKRWQWYFIKGHVHTPPFHPLCFSLNKYLSVRLLDQHNIILTFASNRRSVRFNVGAQLKLTQGRGGHFKGDESEIYLVQKKKRINSILNSLHCTLRLPKSVCAGKFSTPAQRKREKMERLFPLGHLPPIGSKQAVIIS